MMGIYAQDSSYFNITSPDIKDLEYSVVNDDIISFSIEEEAHKMLTGSIQIFDPLHVYSKIFRIGAKLNIEWGYKEFEFSTFSVIAQKENLNESFGAYKRKGIKACVQSPAGSGNSDGTITFSLNFYGSEYLNAKQHRTHSNMTRGTLIIKLLSEMGCNVVDVNFTTQNEYLGDNTAIMQRETNFALLRTLSFEWRTIYRIGYDSRGIMTGCFLSPSQLETSKIVSRFSNAVSGDSIYLDYKGNVNNVIDYSWQCHAGENGSGDNVRITIGADGSPQFYRFVTENETVKVYRLRPERIRAKLKESGNFKGQFALMKEWMNVNDFSQIKQYFDEIDQSTAPQGLGYSMKVNMLGNPMMTVPSKVYFGSGFPDFFSQKKGVELTTFYCRKVNHTIDRSGYKMSLDVADAYTMNGGSFI